MPDAKDEADLAAEQEQYARDEALFRAGRYSKLKFTGTCYNCDEPTEGNFCDVSCRQDYEKAERVKQKTRARGLSPSEKPFAPKETK